MKKLGLFLGAIGVVCSTFAQNWAPATGGSWTNTANWSTATVPDGAASQVFVTNNYTVSPTLTLDRGTAFTVNKISYNDIVTPFVSGTISAGSPAGSLIFAGTTPTVDAPAPAANGADLTISAPVNLSLGLTKTGTRNVYLTGAVTGFGAGVYNTVNAGMLAIGTATTIDWTTVNKTTGGGALRLDALTTLTVPATFSVGAGELSLNPASGTFAFNAAGFTKTGSGVLRFNRDATGPGGSAALTVSGGYLCVNANLSGFASGTVTSGATLQANAAGTYGNIPLTITGPGTSGSQGALHFRSGGTTTVTWPGAITLGSGGATIGSFGVTYNTTLSGAISGTGPLTILTQGGAAISHTAAFTLSSACTYTGNTTFQNNDGLMNSTLKLGGNNTLPTGTVLTLNMSANNPTIGVTFDLNGKSQQLAGLAKNATGTSTKYRVLNSSATASTLTISNTAAYAFDGLIGITANTNLNLIKQGNATLTLSGTNTYSGGTTVSAGTLLVNNTTGSGTGTGNVTVDGGATLGGSGSVLGNVTVNSNGTSSISGTIQGSVTVNSGGTMNGNGFIQGAVSVAAGATLLPGGSGVVGTLTFQNTLTLNGGALFFDLPSSGANDVIALTGAGAAGDFILNGANTVTLNFPSGGLPAGTYTLMTYASQSGSGTLALDPVCHNATLAVGATSVTLTVTGSGAGLNLTWVGGSGNPWDINSSTCWDNGGIADVFFNLDNVLFSDSGSASPAVDVTTAVQPTSVVVSNVVNAYTFTGVGAIAGASTLTKWGTNTLTLANVNTYSGATVIRNGRINYGINDAIGAGAVTVTGATSVLSLGSFTDTVGTVTLDGGATITGTSGSLATTSSFELKGGTVSAIIAGSGAVNAPTNTTTLSGANTYTGPTTVGTFGVPGVVLNVNHPNTLGSTNVGTTVLGGSSTTESKVVLANGVTVTNETLTLDGGASYRAALRLSAAGAATWNGNVLLSGFATYFGSDNGAGTLSLGLSPDTTITGTPVSHSIRGSGTVVVNSRFNLGGQALNRDDAGTVIVNSTSNLWGTTSINQGIVKLGVSEALPMTTLSIGKGSGVNNNAVLDLNGKSQTIASLVEQHFYPSNGTQRIISTLPATLIVNNTNVSTFGTTNSVIEGAVSLVKANTGTLVLTGTNINSGAYIVSNGTLIVSATGSFGINSTNVVVAAGTLTLSNSVAISDTAVVRIANGGVAKVNLAAGVNEAVGTLYFGNLQKGAGTYGAAGSGAGVINSEHFSGTGILTVLRGNNGTMIFLQ